MLFGMKTEGQCPFVAVARKGRAFRIGTDALVRPATSLRSALVRAFRTAFRVGEACVPRKVTLSFGRGSEARQEFMLCHPPARDAAVCDVYEETSIGWSLKVCRPRM